MGEVLWCAELPSAHGALRIVEATRAEVAAVSGQLEAFYADPHNVRMMTNSGPLPAAEIEAFYDDLRRRGAHPFLLHRDEELVGDGDLRDLVAGTAEATLLVGPRHWQGKGLGLKFTLMMCAVGFEHLGLERCFVDHLIANVAMARVASRLGFVPDALPARAPQVASDERRAVLTRARLERAQGETLRQVRIRPRG